MYKLFVVNIANSCISKDLTKYCTWKFLIYIKCIVLKSKVGKSSDIQMVCNSDVKRMVKNVQNWSSSGTVV